MIVNKGRFELRVSIPLHDAITQCAYARHLSVNRYINTVLEAAVYADLKAIEAMTSTDSGTDHGSAGAVD